VADVTEVLVEWVPTSVTDVEKWAKALSTARNQKGTFRRTTRGPSLELNLKHSPTVATGIPTSGIRNYMKQQARGGVFCIDAEETSEDPNTAVTGTLLVNHYAHVYLTHVLLVPL